MLLILYVLDSLFWATHKSKRVSFPPPCAHFVCCWGVHSSPSSLLAGTLLLFWSVHTSWLLGFLTLFGLCCCVRWIFCQPRQTVAQKIVGGFLRLEKRIFPFFSLFSASFSCFFLLFLWRARDRGSGSGGSRVPGGSWWHLGEREQREWVVEARWRCGECGRRGRVCRAGGEQERRRLRDRASSLESGQSGGVGGSWGASRGAAWYWGGGGRSPVVHGSAT